MEVIIDGILYTPEIHEGEPGEKCPRCGNTYNNFTIDSRCKENTGMRIRRRKCESCGTRWKTKEVII